MKRKELERHSRKYSDEEISEILRSHGGRWVLVGEGNDEEVINIIDNDVFKKFEAMQWMEDDEVWDYTIRKYLMKSNQDRFVNHEEMDVHIEELTREKYGS